MANLTSFIYCLNAERVPSNDGKNEGINAMGILSALTPEFVPGTFSFSIIFSILDVDSSNVNNNIRIVFSKADSQDALVDSGIITLPPMSDEDGIGLPQEYKGLNMSMDLRNVIFEQEGVYKTNVYFNGNMLIEAPIYVKGKR